MKWNKSAKVLAVAGLTLASTLAWGQVNIGGVAGQNPIGSVTAPGVITSTTSGTPPVTTTTYGNPLPTINGNAGVAKAGTASINVNGVAQTTLAPNGGDGGPGATAATTAQLANTSYIAGGGLYKTAHDFASGKGDTAVSVAGLCTFCHTPHKAKSTLLLWNHTLSSNTFQWDVAATTSGTKLPGFTGNAYNGPSAKCLSCHDGSVAIGDVGWFDEAAHNGASGALSTFTIGTSVGGKTATSRQVGANGNLSGNHPVAVPYPLNGAPNVYNGSTTGAQLATADFVGDPTVNNIRLYSDVGGGAIVGKVTAGQTGIECSSCHDPHNKASKGDYFLRGTLTGADQPSGYICLQCHVK